MRNSFTPEQIAILARVLDEACRRLSCVDQPTREMLAIRLLNRAAEGENDFATLSAAIQQDV